MLNMNVKFKDCTDSPSVRRRALYAARALSKHEPELLEQIHSRVLTRLKDPDMSTTAAALRVAETLSTVSWATSKKTRVLHSFSQINPALAPAIRNEMNDVFENCVNTYSVMGPRAIVIALEALRIVGYVCTNRKVQVINFSQGSGHRPCRPLLICWWLLHLATIQVCVIIKTL